MVAVNLGDSPDVITKYFQSKGFSFTAVMNGIDENDIVASYGVNMFPTNYVITPDGKVAARFMGFREDEIRAALKRLGVE